MTLKDADYLITKKRVLVTGGAGFIGSNLCEVLLEQDNVVICLDNFSTGYMHNIEDFLDNPKFKLIEGDICVYEDCQKAVEDCDYVMHQAALGSVPRSIENPMKSTDVNIGGFVKILHAAAQAGVKRFVYAASSSTYGDHSELPKVEHRIGKALSPYAITKYVDELIAENFSQTYEIECVGLRYFNVFGRKQNVNGAYAAVIPKFVTQFMKGESPVINGDGSYSRDFTYIDNVLQANQVAAITNTEQVKKRQKKYYASIEKPTPNTKVLNEVINVACEERTNLVELASAVQKNLVPFNDAIQEIEIKFGPNREGDIPHSLASVTKGKLLFGYDPKIKIKQGLALSAKWYWDNL
ncbi:MAG: NAD-dependent epimerase/dehydratase family protein [Salibacteraceae bacterium]